MSSGPGVGESGERRPAASREPADYPAIAWLLVSAAGIAACITLLFLGMRVVMDIGGACAGGGSVPGRSCPDGIAAGITVATIGLFLTLGWNFIEYGIGPPGDEPGASIGWLFVGAVFAIMGAVPLWIAISAR